MAASDMRTSCSSAGPMRREVNYEKDHLLNTVRFRFAPAERVYVNRRDRDANTKAAAAAISKTTSTRTKTSARLICASIVVPSEGNIAPCAANAREFVSFPHNQRFSRLSFDVVVPATRTRSQPPDAAKIEAATTRGTERAAPS